MTDLITLERIKLLHPAIRDEVLQLYNKLCDKGIFIRVTDGLRTIEEQDELYAQGRTNPGKIVTWVQGGDSYHNYGLAFDFCLLKSKKEVTWSRKVDLNKDGQKDWTQVVDLFCSKGWKWGGDWVNKPDYPHLQRTFGKSINELKYLISQGKITNGYVNL